MAGPGKTKIPLGLLAIWLAVPGTRIGEADGYPGCLTGSVAACLPL